MYPNIIVIIKERIFNAMRPVVPAHAQTTGYMSQPHCQPAVLKGLTVQQLAWACQERAFTGWINLPMS